MNQEKTMPEIEICYIDFKEKKVSGQLTTDHPKDSYTNVIAYYDSDFILINAVYEDTLESIYISDRIASQLQDDINYFCKNL